MKRVLVVDDDSSMVELIKLILEKNNFTVIGVGTGYDALIKIEEEIVDACLLDMMLPDINGLQLLQKIRALPMGANIPLIMITSTKDEFDTVLGLELGADDFLHKPFNKRELIARLNVIFRRIEQDRQSILMPISFGDVSINPYTHTVKKGERLIELTPKEFKLLLYFVTNPNMIFSRDQLLNSVWDDVVAIETRTVDVHIRKLRAKIETDPQNPKWIETVRSYGYRFSK
jgi:two-component system alkaline phosphatase synthesis response regulator PhoP